MSPCPGARSIPGLVRGRTCVSARPAIASVIDETRAGEIAARPEERRAVAYAGSMPVTTTAATAAASARALLSGLLLTRP